jgi:DNA topoisomerase-1
VTVATGRFGPFVKHGKLYATLPKGTESEKVTLEEAVALLAARAAKGKGKGKAGKAAAPETEEAAPEKKVAKKKASAKAKKKAA